MSSYLRSCFTSGLMKIIRPRVRRELDKILQTEELNQEMVDNIRYEKLNCLIKHFRSYPFYDKFLNNHGIRNEPVESLEQLKCFPPVTKGFITENLDYLAGRPQAYSMNSTSGSTGTNFIFYESKSRRICRSAAVVVLYKIAGVNYWGDRRVIIWGHSPATHKMQNFIDFYKRVFLNVCFLQGYGMDEQACLKYLRIISKEKPKCIEAYPSYLLLLVRAGKKHNYKPFSPAVIISSGETLHREHREEIESYFSTQISNRYGSREFGGIAQECKFQTGLHIIPTRFIIFESNQGELLVTDLDNYATPFICYAVGDMGNVKKFRCKCGLHTDTIIDLEGRAHDIIKTRSGKLLPGQFWTTASRTIGGVEEFQVIQHSIDDIEFKAKTTKGFDPKRFEILKEKVSHICSNEVNVRLTVVDHIDRTKMGKFRFIINKINQSNEQL